MNDKILCRSSSEEIEQSLRSNKLSNDMSDTELEVKALLDRLADKIISKHKVRYLGGALGPLRTYLYKESCSGILIPVQILREGRYIDTYKSVNHVTLHKYVEHRKSKRRLKRLTAQQKTLLALIRAMRKKRIK